MGMWHAANNLTTIKSVHYNCFERFQIWAQVLRGLGNQVLKEIFGHETKLFCEAATSQFI
jgi:hypothetical protein